MLVDATPPLQRRVESELFDGLESDEPSREHMEQERRMLEWKLPQRQSEEDSYWLAEEESHLQRKLLSAAASSSDRSDTDSMDGANAYQKDRSTPLLGNQLDDRSVIVKKLEPTPTARLDRTHDKVYDATTSVVRAVMLLSQGVQQAKIENYVDLVGLELRTLFTSVDQLVPHFPTSTHREVDKGLSKDMAELVSALKLVERYSDTTLDNEYRKMIFIIQEPGPFYENMELHFSHAIQMNLEASRFGKHAVQHIQIPEAE
ncbi:LOW QUALITY PROTEIN: hypothetical protein DAPPUDRAFT_234007 [Daphnia pulex]|uniref:Focal AT domain-containing protein n=1 Tax=Daphnia pulex TaxID=6669 RepID=E9FUC1_DAPPU|nr:LOW QUALITY PROTEIN: hypothetical protein DAPPUDRAFT_234007 [Daphnia pulex]|eukprot:EFX88947.1 LOW QUALITY PROTEIN: hypothetical protein DAPPUDRAFT_234007 [Daphnia pulex]